MQVQQRSPLEARGEPAKWPGPGPGPVPVPVPTDRCGIMIVGFRAYYVLANAPNNPFEGFLHSARLSAGASLEPRRGGCEMRSGVRSLSMDDADRNGGQSTPVGSAGTQLTGGGGREAPSLDADRTEHTRVRGTWRATIDAPPGAPVTPPSPHHSCLTITDHLCVRLCLTIHPRQDAAVALWRLRLAATSRHSPLRRLSSARLTSSAPK